MQRVGYEYDEVKSFDDVVTWYSEPICDARGDTVRVDYQQDKFHVDRTGSITVDSLTSPRFINATRFSFLEKVRDAVQKVPDRLGRYSLITPWNISQDDPLARIVSNQEGEIRLDILFDGTTDVSTMGAVRKKWRDHLGLQSDEELERVLRPLRIRTGPSDLFALRNALSDKLRAAGLVSLDPTKLVEPYLSLIEKLFIQRQLVFTRDDLERLCKREGLWDGGPLTRGPRTVSLGIRSFMRWADYMEDQTDSMLSLVEYFDNRNVRDSGLWKSAVFPALEGFLTANVRRSASYDLYLDAHSSIAFAAGYLLTKAGVDVAPVQTSRSGTAVWRPASAGEAYASRMWSFSEVSLPSEGTDIAIAVSVTHDIAEDVSQFLQRDLRSAGRLLSFAIVPSPGGTAIADGSHAQQLAERLVSEVCGKRSKEERGGALHLFVSAPNGFTFFLGQCAERWGACVLYEYDFGSSSPSEYAPSLCFPPET